VDIGKGPVNIQLPLTASDDPHAYYRMDGLHYVPKIHLDDLLV
jgi:hypothetical protein